MWVVVILGFLFVTVHSSSVELYNEDSVVKTVNAANSTWKAGKNFANDTPLAYIKSLLGVLPPSNGLELPIKTFAMKEVKIPEKFDSRNHWPNCPSIKHIRDQGVCGSCWAVAAASTFSDRACIATKGKFNKPLSSQELLACCKTCGMGCKGGDPQAAWSFFEKHGVVTGGDYHSHVGCQPYQIQPCEHHTKGRRPQCSALPIVTTPVCKQNCINGAYKKNTFDADHHKVQSAYRVMGKVEDIQREIMTLGPVEAAFLVYSDFPTYKSGVYQHVTGTYLGGHAVRIIGWGKENGTPYWLIANSWNSDWGLQGTFKFLRGKNECGIEELIVAGKIE